MRPPCTSPTPRQWLCTAPGRLSGSVSAPSYAPKLHLKSISKSDAELCWDPVPVEMQNGFITSYTIFLANSTAEVSSESCRHHRQPCPPSHLDVLGGDISRLHALVREGWGMCAGPIWDPLPAETQGAVHVRGTCRAAPAVPTAPISLGATVNPSLSSFVIRKLKPSTLYKVHIMASTAAGSTNGTSLTLVTMVLGEGVQPPGGGCGDRRGPADPRSCSSLTAQHGWRHLTVVPSLTLSPARFPDDIEIQFLFLTLGLIFVLLILLLICFQKNGR